jgi:hypothetical protein
MNSEDAKQILNSALDKAMQKGVYSLQDAALIVQALAVLFPLEKITNND